MIWWKRFYSNHVTKASLQLKPKPTIVHPQRNSELVEYQKQIKLYRQNFRAVLTKKYPPKAEVRAESKAKQREKRDGQWNEYIEKIKREYADNHSPLRSDRHPCRPIVDYAKTIEQRQESYANVAKAQVPIQVMRRKYLAYLTKKLPEFVTRENLISKIQFALEHPVSYNETAEQMVAEEKKIKAALRQTAVTVDPIQIPPPELFPPAQGEST